MIRIFLCWQIFINKALKETLEFDITLTIMAEIAVTKIGTDEEIIETRNIIEKMEKVRQLDILRIFLKHNIYMNENKNGILINMTELPKNVYDEIKSYIEHVKCQELSLDFDEKQKQEYKNTYFQSVK